MKSEAIYPFSALVGQDAMRRALILAAIDPNLGGVLIRGSKGAAKSTAVRALAALLPEIEVFAGDPFHRSPHEEVVGWPLDPSSTPILRRVKLVNLPLGATDDRVVGSLDLEAALGTGNRRFEPGILADAHRGILYIDEVNLLADHLVNLLLDTAAMGVNHVEREGLTFRHPARFVLVGTMNPEEGELRPQLLDRFGLAVDADAVSDLKDRAEIVRRRLDFEKNPSAFIASWEAAQQAERAKIVAARGVLPSVRVPDAILDTICELCAAEGVEGMRADLTICRAASALAAYRGRETVSMQEVNEVAELALSHRRAIAPKNPSPPTPPVLDDSPPKKRPAPDEKPFYAEGGRSASPTRARGETTIGTEKDSEYRPMPDDDDALVAVPMSPAEVRPRWNPLSESSGKKAATGQRGKPQNIGREGISVGTIAKLGRSNDIAIAATIRVAAVQQIARGRVDQDAPLILKMSDLRVKLRTRPTQNLILFCVDASRSMGAASRMGRTKAAVRSLLVDAYQRRNRVGLIAFGKGGARLVLPPTRSVNAAMRLLADVPAGGATPLSAGLALTARVITAERRRNPDVVPIVVLLTDGRGNLALTPGRNPEHEAIELAAQLGSDNVRGLVVDTETGPVRLGIARSLALAWNADYRHLDEMDWSDMPRMVARSHLVKRA